MLVYQRVCTVFSRRVWQEMPREREWYVSFWTGLAVHQLPLLGSWNEVGTGLRTLNRHCIATWRWQTGPNLTRTIPETLHSLNPMRGDRLRSSRVKAQIFIRCPAKDLLVVSLRLNGDARAGDMWGPPASSKFFFNHSHDPSLFPITVLLYRYIIISHDVYHYIDHDMSYKPTITGWVFTCLYSIPGLPGGPYNHQHYHVGQGLAKRHVGKVSWIYRIRWGENRSFHGMKNGGNDHRWPAEFPPISGTG